MTKRCEGIGCQDACNTARYIVWMHLDCGLASVRPSVRRASRGPHFALFVSSLRLYSLYSRTSLFNVSNNVFILSYTAKTTACPGATRMTRGVMPL